jgi:hypothetical protein
MKTVAPQTYLRNAVPADLGPGPRPGVTSLSELNRSLDESFAGAHLTGTRSDLIRAAILLWHDHHDAAHSIVQDNEDQDGSYIHAILHRREPDYFNAKYWFRRVGQHSCFAELATRAKDILHRKGSDSLARKLMPHGEWDSFAFVDACEAAASSAAKTHDVLREIQQAEFEVLLDYLSP